MCTAKHLRIRDENKWIHLHTYVHENVYFCSKINLIYVFQTKDIKNRKMNQKKKQENTHYVLRRTYYTYVHTILLR